MTVTVSEEVQEKAVAALLTGKLEVVHRAWKDGREVLAATCQASRGGGRVYNLFMDATGSIQCDCEARRLCHHQLALSYVVGRAPKVAR